MHQKAPVYFLPEYNKQLAPNMSPVYECYHSMSAWVV